MKTTFKFIIAAMAAISVFSSCQKELANETVNNTTGGVRVISVQFDNSTKASLSGFTPTFTNNDKIRVSNTEKSEECTVTVDGATTTFTTTLSGALTAIYPADAAVLASEAADAPIASSNNFKVLATQDGTVEKAIIASATVAEGENTATFNGLTALFEIAPPSGATSITITSLKAVVSGARTGDAVAINTEGADDAAKRVINVTVPSDGTAYVALKAGVNLTDLSFDAGGTYGMKGIPASKITGEIVDATAANTKYSIDNQNWHPYVTIGGKKWATMNIGANSATEAGDYFMWGYTVGHTATTSSTGAFSDQTFKEGERGDNSKGFIFDNYIKFTSSTFSISSKNVFTKYVPQSKASDYGDGGTFFDNKTTLDLADDAANVNWGGSWRLPTKEEFDALALLKIGDFESGYNFGTADAKIFLPAAGAGQGTGLNNVGDHGQYWSSSLITDTPNNAYGFSFSDGNAKTMSRGRFRGQSVRAVSE